MSATGESGVAWSPRDVPLLPVAAAAEGEVARALAGRLLQRNEQALARLTAVAGPSVLVVLGAQDELPWVDGISYLGRDASAPLLLLPTHLQPSVPAALLQAALLKRATTAGPLAVLAGSKTLIPLDRARALARSALAEWCARTEAPA